MYPKSLIKPLVYTLLMDRKNEIDGTPKKYWKKEESKKNELKKKKGILVDKIPRNIAQMKNATILKKQEVLENK